MKLVLTDNTYDGDVRHEVEDKYLGSDVSLIIEYLNNYKKIMESQTDKVVPPVKIVLEAKINRIKELMDKYKELITFIQYIDSEENAL